MAASGKWLLLSHFTSLFHSLFRLSCSQIMFLHNFFVYMHPWSNFSTLYLTSNMFVYLEQGRRNAPISGQVNLKEKNGGVGVLPQKNFSDLVL